MTAPVAPVLLKLDRERPIKWSERADARLSKHGHTFYTAARLLPGRRGLWALCALVWAALVERDHGFEEPEDLAQFFRTEAGQQAALSAVERMARECGLIAEEKKSVSPAAPSSPAGPGESSNSAPVSPASTSAN